MIVKEFVCSKCGAAFNIYQFDFKEETEDLNLQSFVSFPCTICPYCDIILNKVAYYEFAKIF